MSLEMAKRKTNDLTMKETFINNMIQDSIEHTTGFYVGLISNGKYRFADYEIFLKATNQYDEFEKWCKEMKIINLPIKGYAFDKIYIDEVSVNDLPLPFAELPSEEEVARIERKNNMGE